MSRTVKELFRRLAEISEHRGNPYGRVRLLFEAEEAHSRAILRYKGYLVLSDAFKCFYLETVEAVNSHRNSTHQPLPEYYGLFVPQVSNSFLSLCGAERIAIRGYPYQGYTLVRNVFDNLLLTSAALQKIVSFYSIEGVTPGADYTRNEVRKLRKATERAARRKMTGDQSDLPPDVVKEIALWDSMFDLETHGARLSATRATDWMKGQGGLPVVPTFEERAWALFMNRYSEVAWMLHRLLPALQPPTLSFGESWREKWEILNLSFHETVVELTEQLGKPIGAAIVKLVQEKFPFSADSRFPL